MPDPVGLKDDNEWLEIPRISRTVPFGYKLHKEDVTIAEFFKVENLSPEEARQAIIDTFEGKQTIEYNAQQSKVKINKDNQIKVKT